MSDPMKRVKALEHILTEIDSKLRYPPVFIQNSMNFGYEKALNELREIVTGELTDYNEELAEEKYPHPLKEILK